LKQVSKWLAGINDKLTEARIRRRLDRLSISHYDDVKYIDDGIFELRLQFGSGYRIYFGELGDKFILLLCGGDKGTQSRDIQKAKEYWHEFMRRAEGALTLIPCKTGEGLLLLRAQQLMTIIEL
jgi:putative addiction module killer protein